MASSDFQEALQKGKWEVFLNGILQRSCTMTPFEDIRTRLNLIARLERGRQEIRLDRIIGSVGKGQYFTRSLWPLSAALEDRHLRRPEARLRRLQRRAARRRAAPRPRHGALGPARGKWWHLQATGRGDRGWRSG